MEGSGPQVRNLARLLKGIITLCYYELPPAQADIGYDPVPYVAAVAKRRLERYGEEIWRGEREVFTDERRRTKDEGQPPGEGRAATVNPQSSTRNHQPAGLIQANDVSSDLTVSCDVVIVGSGAGGAVMAAELADAGIDVVVVEEGGYHPTELFTPSAGRALRTIYRDGGAQSALGSPPILFSEGRCVGGSTVINGGMCWRTPDHVLERWSSQEGVAGITPAAMAPYFAKVERRINVAYQDPESIGHDQELLKAGADRLGWHIIPNLRNQLHCGGCNICTSGCPTGAKRSMLVTYLPRALSRGARLYAGCRVEMITRRGNAPPGWWAASSGPTAGRGRSLPYGQAWWWRPAGRCRPQPSSGGRVFARPRACWAATSRCTPTPRWWRSLTRICTAGRACTRPTRCGSSWIAAP